MKLMHGLFLAFFLTTTTNADTFENLKYRNIGPAIGGRVSRAVGIPGDPLTYYFAAAMGGVWKSTDGGIHWKPIFDKQPISSIGSIALAPSDPNVIYVGSGEANIRGNVASGNGIYKSTDAGKTWKHVWKQKGQIGTMIVHPTHPDVAYAAVLGSAFGPNEERGIYRTQDGGKTWKRVLFKNKDTGASDVCFDPNNPRILFAGLWQARRKPWDLISGGPGSGLYFSRNGGDEWTQLIPPPELDSADADRPAPKGKRYCKGLTKGIWGKIAVRVARSNSNRVYALIEAKEGGLFRSDDGGETWARINEHRSLQQRAWYFTHLTIDPKNENVVYCPQVPLLKSIDGGKTFQRIKGAHHGDHHDIWIDPTNPKRMIDSNDGGVDVTVNGGKTWYAAPLPIGQTYHIETDNRDPYHVMGTFQDNGAASGPSNSLTSSGIHLSQWYRAGGGEAGHIVPDPSNPDVVYAGEYGGYVSRFNFRTRQEKNVSSYPFNPSGYDPKDLKHRFQWTAPILVSPHDSKVVYHGGNVLFRTENGGESWKAISPDLTTNDKTKQQWAGGPITGDNTGVEVYCTIFAIAESPLKKGLIWTGSDDGLIHVSRSGGKDWINVTKNVPGMPEWGTVRCIEPSPFDEGTAYVVVERHRLDDTKPYLFKTTDYGKTWKSITSNLAKDVYLHVVRCDPAREALLYLGTERGVQFSSDDGKTWKELKLNLPTVAVTDLKVKNNDLVVGTNGRSIWILDDLTPIRNWSENLEKKDSHFFDVMNAIRRRRHSTPEGMFHHATGKNPPEGAVLHYWLKKRADSVTLEIIDQKGNVVNTLDSKPAKKKKNVQDEGGYSDSQEKKTVLPRKPGLHRVVWDLRYKGATLIPGAKIDMGNPKEGVFVNPGKYEFRLRIDKTELKQTLEVKMDPRTTHLEKELASQLELALKTRDAISELSETVIEMRSVKEQILNRHKFLKDKENAKDFIDQGKKIITEIDKLEAELHNPRAKVTYDILAQRGGAKTYSQLAWLYSQIISADGKPTQGYREVLTTESEKLRQGKKYWDELSNRAKEHLNKPN